MTGLSDDQGGVVITVVVVAGDRGDEMGEIDLEELEPVEVVESTSSSCLSLTGDEGAAIPAPDAVEDEDEDLSPPPRREGP